MTRHPVTYCTNIHPGESWEEVLGNVRAFLPRVKRALCPDAPFPVGLRMPGLAASTLGDAEADVFKTWLDEQGLYVATLNGFPYGTFHGRPVKEQVYLPDWRDQQRAAYTRRLADLLARWLPPGMDGSISTVPVAFGKHLQTADFRLARSHFMEVLEHLAKLRQRTGALIRLSIEPEPGCYVETTAELVQLFEDLNLPPALRAHLACCYDCCHQALQFEDAEASLSLLRQNDIAIGHVQVSSALHLQGGALQRLQRFDEPVYLHQTVRRTAEGLCRHDDLPQALDACTGAPEAEACRVHFHLPVFVEELPECRTTQGFLKTILPLFEPHIPLEVETYTWDVLPNELRALSLEESIVREIRWVEAARVAAASS